MDTGASREYLGGVSSPKTEVDQNTVRRRGVGVRALDRERAFPGYTLFAPLSSKGKVYLIDLEGTVVHEWKLPYSPGQTTYLLPNGNLFYNGKLPGSHELFPVWSAYRGGVVLEADPQGNIVWEFKRPDHHHDASQLKNGNAIVLGLEVLPGQAASRILGGRPGSEHRGLIYQDVIYEVDRRGEIIWTWRANEHLAPEDAVIHAQDSREHWPMANSVNELRDGNLLVSFRNVSKVAIIERSSGKVLWSLDHPVVAQQHYPHELPNGNLLIFDNGSYRTDRAFPYSRVIEVERKSKKIVWQYADRPPQNFFSPYMSSGQRLPNGNTLITEASFGRIFEVTSSGETVWEYRVPFFESYDERPDPVSVNLGEQNAIHRALRYSREQIPWLKA
jgi:outer membrane protein assembly factor BamB